MKTYRKILVLICGFLLFVCVSGCAAGCEEAVRETQTTALRQTSAATTTTYRLSVDPSRVTEFNAAKMLQKYIEIATGENLLLVNALTASEWNSSQYYISVGQTKMLTQAGIGTLAEESVGHDGYIMESVGNSLFIDGSTERGTLYGVLDYLSLCFGYRFINDEIYSFDGGGALLTQNMHVRFTPTFATRSYLMRETYMTTTDTATAIHRRTDNYMLGDMTGYGGKDEISHYSNNPGHNMQAAMDAGTRLYNAQHGTSYDYKDFCISYEANGATHYMPCLSGGKDTADFTTEAVLTLAMKNLIITKYGENVKTFSLTQEDSDSGSGFCRCASCQAAEAREGRSGMLVRFMNKLAQNLENDAEVAAKAPGFTLMTYAYAYTADPPSVSPETLRCSDRVRMMLCLSPADARYSLVDTAHNPATANALANWGKYCNSLMFWGYDTQFPCYVKYFPTVGRVMADNVYALHSAGATYVMMQGAYNAANIWDSDLRAYVYGKLLYDFDEAAYLADAEAYVQKFVSEYCNLYYGSSADAVTDCIAYYQAAYAASAVPVLTNTGTFETGVTADVHNAAMVKIDAAIAAQTDETIVARLHAVKASCMGAVLRNYTTYYKKPSAIWITKVKKWKTEAKAYAEQFAAVCETAGITQWNEAATVSAYVSSFTAHIDSL